VKPEFIPYGRQSISAEDVQAVVAVLQSDWLTQGPMVERFEQCVAEYCSVTHAVATNSATSALHIACLAAGLGPGDILWTSPITFVASANCARYCGANVDFVDIDPHTCNMSIVKLQEKLKSAEATGCLPKVVIPVHFAGQSCDMEAIDKLARQYGFTVIEDASHAIGGRYQGQPIGNCRYAAMTVFSFHPVKIITTGEGGMILTNNAEFHDRMVRLRSHGMTRKPQQMVNFSPGSWYYEQLELGFNYRMTDIQAALGVSQMKRLDEFVIRRQQLVQHYNEQLVDLPVTPIHQNPDAYSAYHLYVIRLDLGRISKSHGEIFEGMRNQGILVNLHYIPVHTQPYYRELGFNEGDFPAAEQYYREAMTLPLYPMMTSTQQERVIQSLTEELL